jgi:Arc/MetJ-type ribon-helix-helix transcriptional regulator
MKQKAPADTLTTVRLPADLTHAMQRLHERDGISTSEQIRRALRAWLTTKKVYKRSSDDREAPPRTRQRFRYRQGTSGGFPIEARTASAGRNLPRASVSKGRTAEGRRRAIAGKAQRVARPTICRSIPKAEKLTFDDAAQAVPRRLHGQRKDVDHRRCTTAEAAPAALLRGGAWRDHLGRRECVHCQGQADTIVTRKAHVVTLEMAPSKHVPAVTKPVSNAEINRELGTLKTRLQPRDWRGLLAMKPKITLLREAPARSGFFEREQYDRC